MIELTTRQRKVIYERLKRHLRMVIILRSETEEGTDDYKELVKEEDDTLKALSFL
jgi:hypothetical protein